MKWLSSVDCAKLLKLTARLYSLEDGDGFARHLLRGMQSLIPHEFGGCHIIQPARHRIATYYEPGRPPLPAHHAEFWRLVPTHPLNRVLFTEPPQAWKLSDLMPRRAFHQTEFYDVLYRPLGVDCELVAVLPDEDTPGGFLLLSLHRQREDFSERDRTLLNLILPHLTSARRRLSAIRARSSNGHWWSGDEENFYEWLSHRTAWRLSRRESEVLFWLCQGKTNSEIGSILGIAGRTAETHALRIYPKMGVENRYNAIATLNHLAVAQRF